jgi:hypothetical protein
LFLVLSLNTTFSVSDWVQPPAIWPKLISLVINWQVPVTVVIMAGVKHRGAIIHRRKDRCATQLFSKEAMKKPLLITWRKLLQSFGSNNKKHTKQKQETFNGKN